MVGITATAIVAESVFCSSLLSETTGFFSQETKNSAKTKDKKRIICFTSQNYYNLAKKPQKYSIFFVSKEKSITFAPLKKESWQSDRMRWTRNPVYPSGYRGFESLTLRKKERRKLENFLLFYYYLIMIKPSVIMKPVILCTFAAYYTLVAYYTAS